MNYVEIIQYKNEPLEGVIHHLYNKYEPELYFLQYIHVKASGTAEGWNEIAPIDPSKTGTTANDNWASSDQKLSNYSVFFPRHALIITDYTLQTQSNHTSDQPKSWILEGSKDGLNWLEIDKKTGVTETKYQSKHSVFVNLNKQLNIAFSHFRFTQTDVNHNNGDYFDIGKLEFFGKLINIHYYFKTCLTIQHIHIFYYINIILP